MHAEPVCTYRLQITPDFDFRKAAAVVPYLRRLGVSHLYLSPILQAAPGSEHGYDVIDPGKVNEEMGGEGGLRTLFAAVESAGMGVVLDIVPNHLAAVTASPWWRDVLRNGISSRHARAFDIDWNPPDASLAGRILLPILGDHLAKILAEEKISPVRNDEGEWELIYGDHRLPVNEAGARMLEKNRTADLTEVLNCQHYRLRHFRLASEDINYRRFFAVQELAGIRVEDPQLWETTHQKTIELAMSGPVDGVRVDHPDGLRDPAEYLRRLRDRLPDKWIVAEKILETGEPIPDWPIDGTTGYDFLQMVGGLWVDPAGEKAVSEFYSDFTGHLEPYGVLVRDKKRAILFSSFEGDLNRLVRLLRAICDRRHLDYPRGVLQKVLAEVIACFPVYRTYLQPRRGEVSASDKQFVGAAIASVQRSAAEPELDLLALLKQLLLADSAGSDEEAEFIARFQQLTSPVMAKGVEDTALYCYDRLLALNEVGCDPTRFGIAPGIFHAWNTEAHERWPRRMLTTSTHDTKRSEDVRARLAVISEIGEEWADHVRRWSAHNLSAWEGREPDRNTEHLLYQTLAGAWPIELDRVQEYMMKACREANRHTSWEAPDPSYESRIRNFVDTVLGDAAFIGMLEKFLPPMIAAGRINSLAQTLLKMTAPGIPDIYQGCEIWDNSLVDPDNRRGVDFQKRADLLDLLAGGSEPVGDLAKMHVIREALSLRRRHPTTFSAGSAGAYRPLLATGPRLSNVVAFCRGETIAVVVPRLTAKLGGDWAHTEIQLGSGRWNNVLDHSIHGETALVADLFRSFPVALMEKQDSK